MIYTARGFAPGQEAVDFAIPVHPRRGPCDRLRRSIARWPSPRRRPLRARGLAPARSEDDRRLRRPAIRRGRRRGDPAVHRRFHRRSRPRPHGERGLRDLPPSGGRAAFPAWRQYFRAGAVPRPDTGVQGRGHAVAGAADGSRAGRARRTPDHRGRDLWRYRRRRGRGVPRPQSGGRRRAVPGRPHFRRCSGA